VTLAASGPIRSFSESTHQPGSSRTSGPAVRQEDIHVALSDQTLRLLLRSPHRTPPSDRTARVQLGKSALEHRASYPRDCPLSSVLGPAHASRTGNLVY